ncbi:MAG TPA: TetR/AcrR family transcriptional regulator [Xanthobacteraceae bacterium]|jgi:AcrR family transcriptional regulator|nr:TetR/AcrR family transcriptional regulator [Xanthobacteraceae bacterium]
MAIADAGIVTLKPRERIVDTARDLFRKHGIRGIGVDTIAEAAGTNKMTLYRHFGSKGELVAECLRDVAKEADDIWAGFERDHPGDPLAQIHDWIRAGAECIGEDGRGCDLANVAVELAEDDHPARRVIEKFKTDQRDRLEKLCRDAGISKAELLADTLSLLLEGARVSRQSVGAKGPCARFVAIGEAVVSAFAGSRPRRPATRKKK